MPTDGQMRGVNHVVLIDGNYQRCGRGVSNGLSRLGEESGRAEPGVLGRISEGQEHERKHKNEGIVEVSYDPESGERG